MIGIAVQQAPIDAAALLARLEAAGGGGVASFTGIVRGDGGLTELFLEHHPAMTETALRDIAGVAAGRWPLLAVEMVHRVGPLLPGERIVFVGAAARHRDAALDATAFLIDWLKTRAPFWKRESFADGTRRWVAARATDDEAAARWDEQGIRGG